MDRLADNVDTYLVGGNIDALRQQSQNMERFGLMVKQWVQAHHGKNIYQMGATGAFEIPSDRGHELRSLHNKFDEIMQSNGSMGVGLELPQAAQALHYAVRQGGGTIAMFDDSMVDEPETTKESELLGLTKAQGVEGVRNEGRAAPTPPQRGKQEPAPMPSPDAGPASLDPSAPPAEQPAGPSAGPESPEIEPNQPEESPREQVMAALKEIKEAAPILEQIKQQSPETYKAIMDIVDAMITMAEKMSGGENVPA
jgi:hypothetical protein